MLPAVLLAVAAEVSARVIGVFRSVGNRVELMISHHNLGAAAVNHRLDEFKGLPLLRPTIDQIANENGSVGAVVVSTGSAAPTVAKTNESLFQLRGATVDVTDDVVVHSEPLTLMRDI